MFNIPHSTSKCNTCGCEDLRWCAKTEAFPRPMIEPPFDRLYLSLRERGKVGLLREEAPHQPDRGLDGAPFPTMERFAEGREPPGDVIGVDVLGVRGPIVVRQGLPQPRRIVAETAREG